MIRNVDGGFFRRSDFNEKDHKRKVTILKHKIDEKSIYSADSSVDNQAKNQKEEIMINKSKI